VITVTPHLAVATFSTASVVRLLCCGRPSAVPGAAAQAAGAAIVIAVVLVAALLTAMALATHYMLSILIELLRVARMAMMFFFGLVLVVALAVTLLARH
jgi:hypothetical protein